MRVRCLGLLSLLTAGLLAAGCKSGDGGGGGGGQGGGDGGGALASCPSNFPDDLISDFESDNSIAAVDGRQGGWYTYHDMSPGGMFATSTGYEIATEGNPNCSTSGSLHVKGTGFAKWGAAMGVDFKPRPSAPDGGYGKKMTYDASKYKGVAFWMKASAPLEGVQISFPDLYTDEAAPSHDMPDPLDPDPANPSFFICRGTDPACNCIYLAGSPSNCSPYLVQFGKKGDAGAAVAFMKYMDVVVDTTWRRYEVLFEDTRQDPGNLGYHHPSMDRLYKEALTAMAIQINAMYNAQGMPMANDFEIWLDDVSFIK